MPLPPSGPISMSMINVELAYPATQVISLNGAEVRALAQVPAGMISLSNFYGKSAITEKLYYFGGSTFTPAITGYTNGFAWSMPTLTYAFVPGTLLGIDNPQASNFANPGRQFGSDAATNQGVFQGNGPAAYTPTNNRYFLWRNVYSMSTESFVSNSLVSASPAQSGSVQSPTVGYAMLANSVAITPFATGVPTTVSWPVAPPGGVPGGSTLRGPNFGFYVGGLTPTSGQVVSGSLFNWDTNTGSRVPQTFQTAFLNPWALSAPNNGYYGSGPRGAVISKISWPTLTLTNPTSLTSTRWSAMGHGTTSIGYVLNGNNPVTAVSSSFANSLTYATDTVASSPLAPDARSFSARFKTLYTF